jgi:hypothetical protein
VQVLQRQETHTQAHLFNKLVETSAPATYICTQRYRLRQRRRHAGCYIGHPYRGCCCPTLMQNSTMSVCGSTASQCWRFVPWPVVSRQVVSPSAWASRNTADVNCGCSSGSPPLHVTPPPPGRR